MFPKPYHECVKASEALFARSSDYEKAAFKKAQEMWDAGCLLGEDVIRLQTKIRVARDIMNHGNQVTLREMLDVWEKADWFDFIETIAELYGLKPALENYPKIDKETLYDLF